MHPTFDISHFIYSLLLLKYHCTIGKTFISHRLLSLLIQLFSYYELNFLESVNHIESHNPFLRFHGRRDMKISCSLVRF